MSDCEFGECCYCQGECNPASQACGRCSRQQTMSAFGYYERKEPVLSRAIMYKVSRKLTKILRHSAIDDGLKMSSDGYVLITDLLRVSRTGITRADVDTIVQKDSKLRFTIKDNLIRANQGHSGKVANILDDELMFRPILISDELPLICYHGTNPVAWKSIKDEGLSPMRRKHVHFATKPFNSDTVISGARKNSKVIIHIDLISAIRDGLKFYMSDNEVLLTPDTVSPAYFEKIEFV